MMKKLSVILLITSLAAVNIFAQSWQPDTYQNKSRALMFFQDFLDFSSGANGLTRLDIFSMVPYTSLSFAKSDSIFTSRYSVTVSIMDKSKEKLVQEKTWNQKIEVKDYEQTTAKDNNSASLKSFLLPPGEYSLKSIVHDQESNGDYLLEKDIKVRDLSSEVAVSDIMILAKKIEDKGINKISPNISGDIIVQKEGIPIFFEIYSRYSAKMNIDYVINNGKKEKVFTYSTSRNVDSGRTQVFQSIKDSAIGLGIYTLQVILKNANGKVITGSQKQFVSRWVGVPALITDLDKAVDEMVYIASPHAIDTIKQAQTREEKLRRFLAYWKKISPTPESNNNAIFDEYYRRVNYANEHFSRYYEGWRSDMGMVFILLGQPDNIDRHPFEIDSKPYEVWEYYNMNQSFIFIDHTGFGDYRLVTPLNGDLYRFRM